MLEMTVRTVDHDPRSGTPVAMLLPRDRAACGPLALPIGPAEACSLAHELERQNTPRSRAYALLAQTLTAIGGYVAAIEIEPGDAAGASIARVRVRLPDGWTEHLTDVTSALGLAVYTSLPVLVSERLARAPTDSGPSISDGPTTAEGHDGAHPSVVPAPFHRALEE